MEELKNLINLIGKVRLEFKGYINLGDSQIPEYELVVDKSEEDNEDED